MTPEQRNQINPETYYSASEIIRQKWFPWIKHINTFRNIMNTPEGQEKYRPVIRSAGKYTFIKIKGENILKVIDLAEQGQLK